MSKCDNIVEVKHSPFIIYHCNQIRYFSFSLQTNLYRSIEHYLTTSISEPTNHNKPTLFPWQIVLLLTMLSECGFLQDFLTRALMECKTMTQMGLYSIYVKKTTVLSYEIWLLPINLISEKSAGF